jgi:hypothetical protein
MAACTTIGIITGATTTAGIGATTGIIIGTSR